MAYDRNAMFEPMGVAALDPKVAAYKKFVKQNLGQPELMQFLQSEQGKQLDPNLAGAMIVLEQLEKARDRTPQGPPPKTSVIQDVGMAGLQKAQEAQMAQGLPQFPNPGMANAQFQGGIATPPQQMASGGIVAFTQGGPSSPVWTDAQEKRLNNLENLMNAGFVFGAYGEPVTGVGRSDELRAAQESAREEYSALRKLKTQVEAAREEGKRQQRIAAERAKYLGEEPAAAPAPASAAKPAPQVAGPGTPRPAAPRPAAPRPAGPATPSAAAPAEDPFLAGLRRQADMTQEQRLAELNAQYAASGMGDVVTARQAEIERQRRELQGAGATDAAQRKKDLMLQLASAAFGSVGKGRNLLESLGSTGAAFTEGASGIQKEYRAKEKERKQQSNAIANAELLMQEAEAARKLGDFKTAAEMEAKAQEKLYAAKVSERQLKLEERKVASEEKYREGQLRIAGEELAARLKPTDAQGKPMSQKEIGDALIALEASEEMAAFKQQALRNNKNAVGTKEYEAAVNAKLMELFSRYFGAGAGRGISGGLPADVATAMSKYLQPK